MKGLHLLIILAAISGGLLFGYEIGKMNVMLTMDAFRIYFHLSTWDGGLINGKFQDIAYDYTLDKTPFYRELIEEYPHPLLEGLIASSLLFGGIFGAISSYQLEKKYGARLTICICSGIFIFGNFIQVFSLHQIGFFLIGRFIAGLSIGCICVICPTYVVEIAPAKFRNFTSTCYQMSVGLGIVIVTLICGILWYINDTSPSDAKDQLGNRELTEVINNKDWKIAILVQAILALILGILAYILPTSPRWLCTKNRDAEAFYIIERLNGISSNDDLIQAEIKAIQNAATDSYMSRYLKNFHLFGKVSRRQSYITITLQFLQQWSGINFYLYYQPKINFLVGFTQISSIFILPLITSIIYFISSIIGMFNIHRFSRKLVLVVGMLIFIFCNIVTYFSSSQSKLYTDYYTPDYMVCDSSKDLKYFVPELNSVVYGNRCYHGIECSNGFYISGVNQLSDLIENNALLDNICNHMVHLRYEQGGSARFVYAGSIILFIFIYACTWGCVPNIYQSELFHHSMRAKGTTLSITSHFLFSALNVLFTPYIIKEMDLNYLILFCIFCGFGFIFTLMFCEEPKGIILDDAERELISDA